MRTVYSILFTLLLSTLCMAQVPDGLPVAGGTLRFYFSPDSLINTAHGSLIDSLNNLADDSGTGNLSFTSIKGAGSEEAKVSHGSLSDNAGITMEGDEAYQANTANWGWIHNGSATKFTCAFVFKVVKDEDDLSILFDSKNAAGSGTAGFSMYLENRTAQRKGIYNLDFQSPSDVITFNAVDLTIANSGWRVGEVAWFIFTYENGIVGDDGKLYGRSGNLLATEESLSTPTSTMSGSTPTWGQKSTNTAFEGDWSTYGDFIWYEKALTQVEIDSLVTFWASKYDTTKITYAKHYQNIDIGTAGGDAGSWSTAIDTWTNFRNYMDGVINHSDTVAMHGDNGTVALTGQTSGIVKDGIVMIDSSVQAVGIDTLIARTDTTKLWGTEFKMINFVSGGWGTNPQIYGIHFDNQGGGTAHTSIMSQDDIVMKLNKFSDSFGSSVSYVLQMTNDRLDFEYNLIVDNSATNPFGTIGIFDPGNGADSYKILHNTIYNKSGGEISTIFSLTDPLDPTPDSVIVKDNLFIQGTNASNSIVVDHFKPDENWNDSDYNIWFRTDPDLWTDGSGFKWNSEAAPYLTFTAWRDSIQTGLLGIDPDGESHSSDSDPQVDIGSDYGYIPATSPAVAAASDGTDIGFFQRGSAGSSPPTGRENRRAWLRTRRNR